MPFTSRNPPPGILASIHFPRRFFLAPTRAQPSENCESLNAQNAKRFHAAALTASCFAFLNSVYVIWSYLDDVRTQDEPGRNFFPEGRKKILWGSLRELTPKGFFSRGKNHFLRFCEGCQAKRNVSPISRRELARASGDRADSGVARNGTPDNKILWNARSDRSV